MAIFDEIKKRLAEQKPVQQQTDSVEQQARRIQQVKKGKQAGSGVRVFDSSEALLDQAERDQARQEGFAGGQAAAQLGLQEQQQEAGIAQAQAEEQSRFAEGQAQLQQERTLADQQLAAERQGFQAQLTADAELAAAETAAGYQQAVQQMATERGIAEADIFQEFQQSRAELGQLRNQAALEQTAFAMSMANKAYVSELERIGDLRGLKQENNFRREAQELIWGAERVRLIEDMGFEAELADDQRAWEAELARMDARQARRIAQQAIDSANRRAMIQGAVDTGMSAYSAYDSGSGSEDSGGSDSGNPQGPNTQAPIL